MECLVEIVAGLFVLAVLTVITLTALACFDIGPWSEENEALRDTFREIKRKRKQEKELKKLGLYYMNKDYYSYVNRLEVVEHKLSVLDKKQVLRKKYVAKK